MTSSPGSPPIHPWLIPYSTPIRIDDNAMISISCFSKLRFPSLTNASNGLGQIRLGYGELSERGFNFRSMTAYAQTRTSNLTNQFSKPVDVGFRMFESWISFLLWDLSYPSHGPVHDSASDMITSWRKQAWLMTYERDPMWLHQIQERSSSRPSISACCIGFYRCDRQHSTGGSVTRRV